MKKQIVYASIIILEFILILHHFKKPTNYYSKIGLLFSIYIIMNSFDSYYIIANSSFILFVILYFYVNYNTRIKKSPKPLVEEQFTNIRISSYAVTVSPVTEPHILNIILNPIIIRKNRS